MRQYTSDCKNNLKNHILVFCYFSFLACHAHLLNAKFKMKANDIARAKRAQIRTRTGNHLRVTIG